MDLKSKWKALGENRQLWITFLGCCFLLELGFVMRAFLGYNSSDEMFCISTAERFFRGERILMDEWQPAQQLCAFLFMPVYALIRKILGSTEGIVIAYRLSFLIYQFLMAVFCFCKLKKRGWCAVWISLAYLIFVPYGFLIFSYNSIQMSVLTLLLVCLSSKEEHRFWEYIIYGVLAAAVVLSNPFCALLFLAYGLLCLLAAFWKRIKHTSVPQVLHLSSFFWICVGAGMVAVLFAVYIVRRGSIGEVLLNLPYILTDPEHKQGTNVYLEKIRRYFYLVYKNYKGLLIGQGVLLAVSLLDKRRYERSWMYLSLSILCTLPYVVYYGFIFLHYPNSYVMLPLTVLGLEAFVLTKKKDRRMFCVWYLTALLFTMVIQLASNTGILVISAACSVSCGAALLSIHDCSNQIRCSLSINWKNGYQYFWYVSFWLFNLRP